ncbi:MULTISPECIES: FecCD family ABC transporter permease [Rubrivivax]|uniref:Iron ABC transporter permease n=1 Tax=Rubrivivax benzoatilyticus TaxID=316997 RepID=A0ABX0HRA3_9BURK|nr:MULTISPECIES: iron ABC transporter permease [Rubrivivax]EGJ11131.1 iron ABC transporter, permease protein [Rubrivivax benzoatilyticus JA2 = ATCC BAA-35]MCD0418250.1 iron ABC transporter permease [Rubrivivax sp. JA1024]NHK97596.1 iron ABC transporter permease [Rubrivivax benzoatilyticus]NHL22709.1 iron ABC transporter permease [Rubrivivax benzoatilyticus]
MNPALALDLSRRRRLVAGLALAALALSLLGLAVGSEGWSWHWSDADSAVPMELIVGQIRAPRTIGALLVGALLGLAGAIAQGLFRNPLADPYLLGTGSGASLAVVAVLAASAIGGHALALGSVEWLARIGLVGAAFVGALGGVTLTLMLARGAQEPMRLLLSGVVVGVVLGAASDLVTTWVPDALRGKQSFMLGSTGFLGWQSVALLAVGLALALPPAWRLARALDALGLGEESAASLGLALPRLRLLLVVLLALCTALAVSQAGLVGFVGLVSPHLVRRFAPAPQRFMLPASAAAGGVLMLGADVLARGLIAPQELPVGVLTAVLGGGYLLWLLHKRGVR